ncbi:MULTISPECIES: hypothetical protein [unclassified Corallococcus]|uniref:hypothetical protein n=1 Tax=unclassified Corallococcus TaxID=2685029 RepID=UPI001A8D67CD|nr:MULTISPECIES: hypothetical protein [unclassified Corallococcus]MBN9685262.1 hypothetical protein [Corallococcus sp. NCSPR001]WAS83283.1 hypothetical protein O0N60_28695 [Corallococcus sp. NCRR]
MRMGILAMLTMATPVLAQDDSEPKKPAGSAQSGGAVSMPSDEELAQAEAEAKESSKAEGTLEIIKPRARTLLPEQEFIVKQSAGRDLKFRFNKKTDKELAQQFSELQNGDQVTVSYNIDKEGNRVIQSLKKK